MCGMYVNGEHECKTFTIWCVYVYINIIIHGTTKVVHNSLRLEKFRHWYFFRVFLFKIPASLHFTLYLSGTRCLKSTFHPQLFPFWPVVDIFPSTHHHTPSPKGFAFSNFTFHLPVQMGFFKNPFSVFGASIACERCTLNQLLLSLFYYILFTLYCSNQSCF